MEYNKTFQSQAKHMPLGIIRLTPLNLGSYPACVFDMCYIKPFLLFPYVTDGLITCLCRLCSGISKSLFLFTTLLYDPYVMDFCLCVCFGWHFLRHIAYFLRLLSVRVPSAVNKNIWTNFWKIAAIVFFVSKSAVHFWRNSSFKRWEEQSNIHQSRRE